MVMRSLLAVVAVLALLPASASAATFTVTTTADGVAGSLRAAVQGANGTGGPDDIVLDSATYVMSVAGNDNTNAAGDFDVTGPTRILGEGAAATVIDANDVDRIFDVRPGASLTLNDLTVTDTNDSAGAIQMVALPAVAASATLERTIVSKHTSSTAVLAGTNTTLTVRDSLFDDNDTDFAGGIVAQGTAVATITGTTFREADVAFSGGGVLSQQQARVTISDSRFEDNSANVAGGALLTQGNAVVNVTDSVFARNDAGFGGGAMFAQDDSVTTIERSTFTGNSSRLNGQGGGAMWVQHQADVTVRDSTLSENVARTQFGGGGALFAQNAAKVIFERSTLAGNAMTASPGGSGDVRGGGGAFVNDSASVTLRNATVDGNTSDVAGGGFLLADNARLELTHATVSANSAAGPGDGIANLSAPPATTDVVARIERSIFADGGCSGGPAAGVILSEGSNVETGDTCGAAAASDRRNADAKLGPLADNGGLTPTRSLLVGSAARDIVPTGACVLASDQRGVARPRGSGCDAGAFEADPPLAPPFTPPAAPAADPPAVVTPPAPVVPPRPLPALKTSQVLSLPSARRCVSRRSFRIRLRTPRGASITRVVVRVNNKRVRTVRGRRITAPVSLRGLPRGRFTVSIEIATADGRKVTAKRRYRTCAPRKRR